MAKFALIIEDDPAQRRLLDRMLTAAGWRIATAPDGEAGLAAARSHPPDIIVLDVMMPRLNGYQVCRQLKADPATRAIPVVMVTSKDQPADEFWAKEVGAEAFVPKPVDVIELAALLDRLTVRA
ncbi:MAG: response regulator [Gemmatimonadota bacterium]|nr:response regulator [Gemmatimonadota bacterium]